MPNIVVVGAQWGDEAKGKIVDWLARGAEMVVRYGGGSNAGHTVTADGRTHKLHLVPCGVLHRGVACVIADGVVVDPGVLAAELRELRSRGISTEGVRISSNAHVIMPYHRLQDRLDEERKGANALGTTGRGIGPAYADKAARVGIRMHELVEPSVFAARVREQIAARACLMPGAEGDPALDADAVIAEYSAYADDLRPAVAHTVPLIAAASRSAKGVVFEGAQGTLLDLDLGTYPYVTSSHPVAGGACLGTGVGPTAIHGVVGVAKSYTTRVGAGVFPTELLDATGDRIRERGNEYGTTTGRPRRCGWLDTVVLRYSAQVNGLTCMSLGHLDVLSGFDTVKVATAYRIAGQVTDTLPPNLAHTADLTPVYEELAGWSEDVTEARRFDELPAACRAYVRRVAELTGVPVATVSVGPSRDQLLIADAAAAAAAGFTGS
ncbi:MAG TPA: adenylosuccinate synthase [Chthonomonadales bacterium]|nr:adenylosuccinate synthase [Chthonomonadales bacterium]